MILCELAASSYQLLPADWPDDGQLQQRSVTHSGTSCKFNILQKETMFLIQKLTFTHLTFKQVFNNNIFHIISSSLRSLKCFMPVMTHQSLGVNSVWSCIMLNVYLTLWGPLLWSTHREGVELDKGVESLTTWKSLLSRSESSFWSSSWGNFQLILMMISFFTSGTHIWWKEADAHPQNNLCWSVPL